MTTRLLFPLVFLAVAPAPANPGPAPASPAPAAGQAATKPAPLGMNTRWREQWKTVGINAKGGQPWGARNARTWSELLVLKDGGRIHVSWTEVQGRVQYGDVMILGATVANAANLQKFLAAPAFIAGGDTAHEDLRDWIAANIEKGGTLDVGPIRYRLVRNPKRLDVASLTFGPADPDPDTGFFRE